MIELFGFVGNRLKRFYLTILQILIGVCMVNVVCVSSRTNSNSTNIYLKKEYLKIHKNAYKPMLKIKTHAVIGYTSQIYSPKFRKEMVKKCEYVATVAKLNFNGLFYTKQNDGTKIGAVCRLTSEIDGDPKTGVKWSVRINTNPKNHHHANHEYVCNCEHKQYTSQEFLAQSKSSAKSKSGCGQINQQLFKNLKILCYCPTIFKIGEDLGINNAQTRIEKKESKQQKKVSNLGKVQQEAKQDKKKQKKKKLLEIKHQIRLWISETKKQSKLQKIEAKLNKEKKRDLDAEMDQLGMPKGQPKKLYVMYNNEKLGPPELTAKKAAKAAIKQAGMKRQDEIDNINVDDLDGFEKMKLNG